MAYLLGDQRFKIRILIENHIGEDGHHDEMREVIAAALIKTRYVQYDFQVIFQGPGENVDRLRVPERRLLVTPAVEIKLNERQKRIIQQVLVAGSVTRRWCVAQFKIANDTAGRDLKGLTEMGLLDTEGKGRAVSYVLPIPAKSTDN
jgi:predicted HTH transcriptional regulator